MTETNPFNYLFDNEQYSTSNAKEDSQLSFNTNPELLNDLLESTFHFTLDSGDYKLRPYRPIYAVFLNESSFVGSLLNIDNLDEAIFCRLCMQNPKALVKFENSSNFDVDESGLTNPMFYLFECFVTFSKTERYFTKDIRKTLAHLIFNYAKLCITNPDLSPTFPKSVEGLFLSFQSDIDGQHRDFFQKFIELLLFKFREADEMWILSNAISSFYPEAIKSVDFPPSLAERHLQFLIALCRNKFFKESFAKNCFASVSTFDQKFERSLLGSFLSKSFLPSFSSKKFLFFDAPAYMSEDEMTTIMSHIWLSTDTYSNLLYRLLLLFLEDSSIRSIVTKWISSFLNSIKFKAQDASIVRGLMYQDMTGDGCIVNMLIILLNLSLPFCNDVKIHNVKAHYAACKCIDAQYLKDTTFIIQEKEPPICENCTFNFSSECFYATHYCLFVFFTRMNGLLKQIYNESEAIEMTLQNLRQQSPNDPSINLLEKLQMKGRCMSKNIFTCLKMPKLVENISKFITSTTIWLSAANPKDFESIPEFVIENVGKFVFTQNFTSEFMIFEIMGDSLIDLESFFISFMGDRSKLPNPHLRAALAEAMATLLPTANDSEIRSNRINAIQRTPCRKLLPKAALDVFVTVELAGVAVSFELKFQYRLAVHSILSFVYKSEDLKNELMHLGEESIAHIEDVDPPLFLYFVNLLLNDANFLLDEAIANLEELRQLESNPEPRHQDIVHLSSLTRYRNILSQKTIETLRSLTSNIQNIFCHISMVDRVAAMLNYVLSKLVGPNSKKLKVKNMESIHFKPKVLISKVVDIYLNLGSNENFIKATARDRGHYSDKLFELAEEVLWKVSYPPVNIHDFIEFRKRVRDEAAKQDFEDSSYDDAPDDFIDPITSLLMTDPVILPTSGKILDRVTITRHLLSDQTDPFNRMPLQIRSLIPADDLRKQIETWKNEKNKQE